ncbi:hypothetical protein AAC387_Pa09g1510 [Persea americana]
MVSTVSSLGRGRMAALARLLVLGGFPEATAEEANIEKLAIQSICRELHEADEANLLNEEDMHVFDCRPLTDPLNLKPVKASQFAPHAERCRTLNFSKDIVLELDGGTGHKKPPRKGKKKLQTAHYNQTAIVGERERSESIDGEETTVGLNMDDQTGLASSLFREAKRDSTLMDGALVIDGSGVNSGSTNHSMGVVSPSEKRTKLIAALPLPVADCIERIYGVTTEMETSCQDAVTCVPVPLATKMYHSQRSHLRAALGHLYHEALVEDPGNDSLSPKIVPHDTALASQKTAYGLCVLRKPDQTLSDSSDLCFGAASAPKNQFLDDKISRPVISVDSASTRMIRTRYHPTPYSFPGNSGTTVGTVQ